MTLLDANTGDECIVSAIKSNDEELKAFLFTLGCYPGEPVYIVSKKRKSLVIGVKDGKYSIDNFLAEAILI